MHVSIFCLGAAILAAPAPATDTARRPADTVLADTVQITEWTVPWERTRPRDPFVDAEGRVWFVGQAGNYIARLDPASGRFQRYEITDGTHPHNLIVDDAGVVWYAGNRNARIGRLDPKSGAIREFPMPDPAIRDPHTLVAGRGDEIWFTAQGANVVGRFTPSTGAVRTVKVAQANARPYGIVVDAQGTPWVALFGTNRIASVDRATMTLREYELPHDRARARRLVAARDGAIWYVDYTRGFLGRLDPETGKVVEWQTPGGVNSMPYALTVDSKNRLWFSETGMQPVRMIGFDPRSQQFTPPVPVPSGGMNVRYAVYHAPTGAIWFGTDANTIARAQLP